MGMMVLPHTESIGRGVLVFAAEGMTEEFISADPWFAGWSAIMANVVDITAMGDPNRSP